MGPVVVDWFANALNGPAGADPKPEEPNLGADVAAAPNPNPDLPKAGTCADADVAGTAANPNAGVPGFVMFIGVAAFDVSIAASPSPPAPVFSVAMSIPCSVPPRLAAAVPSAMAGYGTPSSFTI